MASGRRDSSTAQKLDMALDDLVDSNRSSYDYRSAGRSPHRDRHRDRHGPYSWHDGKGDGRGDAKGDGKGKGSFGKGKGRRRLPMEEKALLNTQCFFNAEGHLVVRLYDTEVCILKKRPEACIAASELPVSEPPAIAPPLTENKAAEEPVCNDSEKVAPDGKPAGTTVLSTAGEQQIEVNEKPVIVEEKPVPAEESKGGAASDSDAKPTAKANDMTVKNSSGNSAENLKAGMVLVLTSGKFRTAETKYIINEALHSLSFKLAESSDSSSEWTVSGATFSQPFEDGMSVDVNLPMEQSSVVKQLLVDKIQEAKAKESQRSELMPRYDPRDRGPPPGFMPPEHWGRHGPPPQHLQRPPDWPHGPPPGWSGPPSLGWRGPPPLAWCGPAPPWDVGPGPHRHPAHPFGAGPAGKPGLPTPRGPLPDNLFQ
mmetsp:Transcript_103580/g.333983  ORF Transcript_103580/g.333983 Transcript_103580/m.333983 type:complete len:426 (-) Transcript_103580:72-1349(-)